MQRNEAFDKFRYLIRKTWLFLLCAIIIVVVESKQKHTFESGILVLYGTYVNPMVVLPKKNEGENAIQYRYDIVGLLVVVVRHTSLLQ
jgi:uncharacterized membrane protein